MHDQRHVVLAMLYDLLIGPRKQILGSGRYADGFEMEGERVRKAFTKK
jgi:hypothetical protein